MYLCETRADASPFRDENEKKMVGQIFQFSFEANIHPNLTTIYAQFLYEEKECRRYQHLRLRISLGLFISLIGCLAEILSFPFLSAREREKKNLSVHIKKHKLFNSILFCSIGFTVFYIFRSLLIRCN